jgi:hypothetical protein
VGVGAHVCASRRAETLSHGQGGVLSNTLTVFVMDDAERPSVQGFASTGSSLGIPRYSYIFPAFVVWKSSSLRPLSGWLYLLHLLVYPCSSPLDKHDVSSEGQRDLGLALSMALRFGVGVATVSA